MTSVICTATPDMPHEFAIALFMPAVRPPRHAISGGLGQVTVIAVRVAVQIGSGASR